MQPINIKDNLNYFLNEINAAQKIDNNTSIPFKALQFLYTYPEAFNEAPVESDRLIKKLSATDLSKAELDSNDWKIVQIMANEHPGLFADISNLGPKITVSFQGKKIEIAKNQLAMQSDLFRKHLSSIEKNQGIELNAECSSETIDAFLNFLQTGKAEIKPSIALELLKIANEYQVYDLKIKAEVVIIKKWKGKNLANVLECAIQAHSRKLCTKCLRFIIANPHLLDHEENLDPAVKLFSDNAKELIPYLNTEMDGPPIYRPTSPIIDNALIERINTLTLCTDIGLDLTHFKEADTDQIHNWVNRFDNLSSLKIQSENLTEFKSEKLIDFLDLSGCPNLKSIYVFNVDHLDSWGCPILASVICPGTRRIDVSSCDRLESLEAKDAENVDCRECPNILELNLPKAIELYCSMCFKLRAIYAHLLEILDCDTCPTLKSINTPNADRVFADHCSNLIEILADRATSVTCQNCPNLRTLKADDADEIDCSWCFNLVSLSVKNVKNMYCPGCIKLTSLNLPNVEEGDLRYCPGLKELNVKKGADIIYYDVVTGRPKVNLEERKRKR